ncbi:double-stranded RNA-specific adenosine deaminase isoform X2 [Spea bombifrons]|uniref:double-stranded RNA-specific adenosine deaminase isoform X2 n=1 Tax=Spea bombifrons TaxID=233779 RepID=UPI002349A6E7|nr:double-stranded RNA-specific adenosine deaminase isoform X2 [Spea bombifrons]
MNRRAYEGQGRFPKYKSYHFSHNPNTASFINPLPIQEYQPDILRAQQREFLLGRTVGFNANPQSFNAYRAPQKHYPPQKTAPRPPQYPYYHQPSNRGPPERNVTNLSQSFQALHVSSDPLEKDIVCFFGELNDGETRTAKYLSRYFRVEKKVVNHILYKLLKTGVLWKDGETPPRWRIPSACTPPVASSVGESQGEGDSEEGDDSTSSLSRSFSVTWCPQTMAENKEKVFKYLFHNPLSTSLSVRKNVGIAKPHEINQLLNALEKQGDVCRNGSNPIKWSLSAKKHERMLLKERASEIQESLIQEEPVQVDDGEQVAPNVEQVAPNVEQVAPNVEQVAPNVEQVAPKTEQVAPNVENGQKALAKDNTGGERVSTVPSAVVPSEEPPKKRSRRRAFDDYENGKWALDDLPESLNVMNRASDIFSGDAAGDTMAITQYYEPTRECSRLEKLQACQEKNPVSGLLEFAHFCSEQCDFVLLEQSGPSHDPRFKIQAVINGRRFPPAEASSKKNAKKEAASLTLRILLREEQGGTEEQVLAEKKEVQPVQEEVKPVLQSFPSSGKNPISVLMEHGQKSGNMCEFVLVSQEGPPHDPRFTYMVKIGKQTFPSVVANNKKMAKQLAAEAAVRLLLGESVLQTEKFEPVSDTNTSEFPAVPELSADELKMAQGSGVRDFIKYLNANPVSGLLEYSRAKGFAAEFRMVNQTGPPHDPKFVFQAKVGGRWFPAVTASSKKQAKAEAADAALRVLIGESEKAVREGDIVSELPVGGSTIHDQIAMLSHQKFNSLTARIQNSLLGRKILAAIIMKKSSDDLGTVVSIGTGNRCVKGEELSLSGETVNDCHAEVISRRGFIRFLYSQLMKYNPEFPEDTIFEEAEGDLLRVKPNVTFHLYISTAPCGDGALFDKSCSEQPSANGDNKHYPLFENPKQGKLRTKVENGEGTIPVESSDIVPTWDGIQHGERLRTMSCSDKILRWNVLGLQGAILTHFLEPVYLSSLTLGYLFSQGHLTRAICCRMTRDGDSFQQQLPDMFIVNHPEVGRVSVYDSHRQTGKTKESSVNWCMADEEVEVLDGTKGKVEGAKLEVSRVTKLRMFSMFQELCRQHKREDLLHFSTYGDIKAAATSYQKAKGLFFKALESMGYGNWIGKPQEEKSFTVASK